MIGVNLRIASRALCATPMRSLLTVLGIMIGVAALITMVAVTAGAGGRIDEQIRSLGANLLMVLPGSQTSGGARLGAGTRHTLTEEDAAAIAHALPVTAAPTVSGKAQLVHANRNWSSLVGGIVPDYLAVRDWRVARGRPITAADVARSAKVALLGAATAKRLFEDVDPIGRTVRIGRVPCEVVGVLAPKGQEGSGRDQDDVVLMPLSTARARVLGGGHAANRRSVSFILVKAPDAAALEEVERGIATLLRQRHRIAAPADDDFIVRNPAAAAAAQAEAMRSLGLLFASVALVSLVVGGISIMNIMLVSVTERTREIGLRQAVGARPGDIRNQFLMEATILAMIGGVTGIGLGAAVSTLIATLADWPVRIDPLAALLAVGFSGCLGIVFGLYPAARAAHLEPIAALRHE
ncbi:MAG TPA: ABC transporter permease [Azospirillum sp.]|nr:ABC transporter permease [Azospirillum sp.]